MSERLRIGSSFAVRFLLLLLLGWTSSLAAKDEQSPMFRHQSIDSIQIGYGLAIGDVDGDARPDILLADKKQFVWYRNPDWKKFVMVENLTRRDNVCIAARDINGDGMVEVAVGAMWNPGNTTSAEESGSVHYLIRPDDPTKSWEPVQLPHEPTTHRMRWARAGDKFRLVVLPLHGRGNRGGRGAGVKILAYDPPADVKSSWKLTLLDDTLHKTHNLDVRIAGKMDELAFAGREGVKRMTADGAGSTALTDQGAGEVRFGRHGKNRLLATIEPMHGHQLVLYTKRDGKWRRQVLDDTLQQGHAVACADLFGSGGDEIVVGWRAPNDKGKVGVKMFTSRDGVKWTGVLIDDEMACEDLRVADLNADGRRDIVAAGRATKNLKIYWSRALRKEEGGAR